MSPDQRGRRSATSSLRASVPSMPSTNSAAPRNQNTVVQLCSTAASSANRASAAPDAVKMCTPNAPAFASGGGFRSGACIAAPVEPHQLGRAAGKIPVAAERAHAGGLGAGDGHVGPDPIAAVAHDDVLPRLLALDRLHHALDDLGDLENVRTVLDLVDDRLGAHAEE